MGIFGCESRRRMKFMMLLMKAIKRFRMKYHVRDINHEAACHEKKEEAQARAQETNPKIAKVHAKVNADIIKKDETNYLSSVMKDKWLPDTFPC
jgi:hypothetical protein